MKFNTKIAAVAIAVLSFGSAGFSLAHPGGYGPGMGAGMGYGMGPGMGYGMGGMGGMGWGMGGPVESADAAKFVAERMAALKAELKITPAQEAAWTAFQNQAQQQVTSMQALRKQMQEQMHGSQADRSATDFSALREAMFKLREANQAAHAAVTKDLYAVLTPEQRSLADRRMFGPGYGRGYGRDDGRGEGRGFGPGAGRGCAWN